MENSRELSEFYTQEITQFRAEWEIPKAYSDITHLSAGQYGTVARGFVKNPVTRQVLGISDFVGYDDDNNPTPRDHSKPHVVIKRLQTPFYDKTLAKRCMREIAILKHLHGFRDHINIMSIYQVFSPDDWKTDLANLKEIYISTSYDGTPLDNLIGQMQAGHLRMEIEHIAFLSYQLLCGLNYIHTSAIVHRDIKPSNIVVDEGLNLKIIDFGLARSVKSTSREMTDFTQTNRDLTTYVQARAYRAPELLWLLNEDVIYDTSIDIWSFGLILMELLLAYPIFLCDNEATHCLTMIELLGKITYFDQLNENIVNALRMYPNGIEFATSGKSQIESKLRREMQNKFDMNNSMIPFAIDLVQKSLTWGPTRISAEELLKADLFEESGYYDPECPVEELPEEELPGATYQPQFRISHMGIDDLKQVISENYLTTNC